MAIYLSLLRYAAQELGPSGTPGAGDRLARVARARYRPFLRILSGWLAQPAATRMLRVTGWFSDSLLAGVLSDSIV
ncbi:MAG TPA: hypothetical protein PLG21_20225, partial [Anaerolineae bacterium]|nr:hypothetical protein [Anaerolineae bacterium]